MEKILSLFFFVCVTGIGLYGQETAKSIMERKKKALDSLEIVRRFDGNLIVDSVEIKARFEANEKKRAEIMKLIDGAPLKERQKEKLRHDLVHNPFSARLKKFIQEQKPMKKEDSIELVGTIEK